jgi:hypothetical protein
MVQACPVLCGEDFAVSDGKLSWCGTRGKRWRVGVGLDQRPRHDLSHSTANCSRHVTMRCPWSIIGIQESVQAHGAFFFLAIGVPLSMIITLRRRGKKRTKFPFAKQAAVDRWFGNRMSTQQPKMKNNEREIFQGQSGQFAGWVAESVFLW